MDILPAHLNKDSFRDSFKGLVALEIIHDLPIGFSINNIISRTQVTMSLSISSTSIMLNARTSSSCAVPRRSFIFIFFYLRVFIKNSTQQEEQYTLRSKDTEFAKGVKGTITP